ncbi:MAG TPA: DUF4406 domain-containing protein [Dissulfurispiraceae bacterium]|nr:DUF4406 domain-containing protein [Dissulfurispiraceae bacterium]
MPYDLLPGLISGSTVYISGPIGDYVNGQKTAPQAAVIEGELVRLGYMCYNPFGSALHERNFIIPKRVWLEHDEYWIRHCDAIVLLPGWRNSEGACYEVAFGWQIKPDMLIYEWQPTADNYWHCVLLERGIA